MRRSQALGATQRQSEAASLVIHHAYMLERAWRTRLMGSPLYGWLLVESAHVRSLAVHAKGICLGSTVTRALHLMRKA